MINRLCANNNTVVLSQIFLFIIQDFATTCVTLLRLCVLNDLSFYNPCLSLFLLPDLLMASVHWVLIPYLTSAFYSTHRFVVLSGECVWRCLDSVGNAFTNEAFSNQEWNHYARNHHLSVQILCRNVAHGIEFTYKSILCRRSLSVTENGFFFFFLMSKYFNNCSGLEFTLSPFMLEYFEFFPSFLVLGRILLFLSTAFWNLGEPINSCQFFLFISLFQPAADWSVICFPQCPCVL